MSDPLLKVRGLTTRFFTQEGQVNAVEGVSFDIGQREVLGIVGESGSGKSVTALSLIDLVASPGRIVDGEIWYRDEEFAAALRDENSAAVDGAYVDIRQLPEQSRDALRGPTFGTIFQDPASNFNPSLTVGEQIAEAVEVQRRASAKPRSTRTRTASYGLGRFLLGGIVPGQGFLSRESKDRAVELLDTVGIPDPAQRADEYPHEYSGGMLQRAMIAQALAGEPDLLIADEPTTALDVTIQAQVLELLRDLKAETGLSILLITHNLGVVARMCDRVGVMYAGEIVERGTNEDIFDRHVHPYTEGLLGSLPDLDGQRDRLTPIEGNVPSLLDAEMADRCYFADRCPKAMEECLEKPPELAAGEGSTHTAKCYLAEHPYEEGRPLPADHFETEEHDD